MEPSPDIVEETAAAVAVTSPVSVVALTDIASGKAVDVRTDGIYESDNQSEGRAASVRDGQPGEAQKTLDEETTAVSSASPVPAEDAQQLENALVESPAQLGEEGEGEQPHHANCADPAVEDLNDASSELPPRLAALQADDGAKPPSTPAALEAELGAATIPDSTREPVSMREKKLSVIQENQCSSHSQEIHKFVTQALNEKQRKRYLPPLVQRIAQQFHLKAQAQHEEVSLDVQSSICLLEQMFLTIGRASPFQDMYTTEEEELLDQLAHSARSSEGPALQ